MNKYSLKFLAILLITGCSFANKAGASLPSQCPDDSKKQELRSKELQEIVRTDQDDRLLPADKINWEQILPKDEARRKRVGEIFGEGCFKQAKDYAAAALVYQHGNVPDHFYQTFLWAKKAVELGDTTQSRLMVMGLDRYLLNIGHKQLFATQATKPINECWCLEEVEKTYPETERIKFSKRGLQEAFQWVDSLNNDLPNCKPAKYCQKNLKNSEQGIVPGFW